MSADRPGGPVEVTERSPGVLRFAVRVVPGASASRIEGGRAGALRVRLAAPPVDGAANAALRDLLAESLGVRPRAVVLVAGAAARTKVVEVTGVTADRVRQLAERSTA